MSDLSDYLDSFDEQDYNLDIIRKFDSFLNHDQLSYFDLDEFIEPLDYYLHKNNLKKFEKILLFAITLYPESKTFKLYEVELLIEKKQTGIAKKKLDIASKNLFDENDIFKSASLYSSLDNIEESVRLLKGLLKNTIDKDLIIEIKELLSDYYFSTENAFLALSELQEILYNFSDKNFNIFVKIFFIIESEGLYKKGIAFFNELIDKDAYNTLAWNYLGKSQQSYAESIKGKNKALYQLYIEKAIFSFEYALITNAKDVDVMFSLSNVFYHAKQYEKCISQLKDLIKEEGTAFDSYLLMSKSYYKLREYSKSLDYAKFIYQTFSVDTEVILHVAKIYYHLSKYNHSLNYINKIIEKGSETSDLLVLKGLVLEAKESINEAFEAYKDAYKLNPENIKGITNLFSLLINYKSEIEDSKEVIADILRNKQGNYKFFFKILMSLEEASKFKELKIILGLVVEQDAKLIDLKVLNSFNSESKEKILRIINNYFNNKL